MLDAGLLGGMVRVAGGRWVHGCEPLGDGQDGVRPENWRLLLQPHLRGAGAAGPAAS
ncbi:hypothetical protein ACIQU1_19975 [Streptomyces angustmyceticus]|uniref:hypothetical protein n=1 Tax=Streptomyces angustmyceticus TaxID=285578 RepID=UPI00344EAD82